MAGKIALVHCAANERGIVCAREVHYQQVILWKRAATKPRFQLLPKSERVQPLDAARLATLQVVTWL
jgi:hypothetical protein